MTSRRRQRAARRDPTREISDVVLGHDPVEHDESVDCAGQIEQRGHAGRVILARATEQQRVAVRRRSRLGASNDDVGIEKARLLHGEDVVVQRGLHEDESENPVFAARKTPRHGIGDEL